MDTVKDSDMFRGTGRLDDGAVRERTKSFYNKDIEISPAFKQIEFASSYESRINQTSSAVNTKIEFEGVRGGIFKHLSHHQMKRLNVD